MTERETRLEMGQDLLRNMLSYEGISGRKYKGVDSKTTSITDNWYKHFTTDIRFTQKEGITIQLACPESHRDEFDGFVDKYLSIYSTYMENAFKTISNVNVTVQYTGDGDNTGYNLIKAVADYGCTKDATVFDSGEDTIQMVNDVFDIVMKVKKFMEFAQEVE